MSIDRILNMIIRMITRKQMRKGVGMAMGTGSKAWENRKQRKAGARQEAELEQDPAVTQRRKLKSDEQKGDDVLYPTDDFTEDMQPRR